MVEQLQSVHKRMEIVKSHFTIRILYSLKHHSLCSWIVIVVALSDHIVFFTLHSHHQSDCSSGSSHLEGLKWTFLEESMSSDSVFEKYKYHSYTYVIENETIHIKWRSYSLLQTTRLLNHSIHKKSQFTSITCFLIH